MKQKLRNLILTLLLLTVLPLTALAEEVLPPMVVDNAGLFTAEEAAALESKALDLRQTYAMDIVVLTETSLGGTRPQEYADDYFDYNGYGYGDSYSGILFLLDMGERDWYISTSGDAIFALTDYGIQVSGEAILPYLSEGEYYAAFDAWMDDLVPFLDAFESGEPIDGYADYSGDYYHGDQEDVVYYEEEVTPSILLSLMVGLVVAGITVLVMRLQMNTKRPSHSAQDYMEAGSFHLRTQQDLFLYSQVTKTPRPKDPPPSSGGGSSVHTSSSGRSHGGGGGKF